MKNHTLPLFSILLATGLTAGACTKGKQDSQQPNVNSTMTDARPDLSNQPNPVSEAKNADPTLNANANPNQDQKPVTTNPNSSRDTTDSTINTSAGAAVVGDDNMNPRAQGEAAKVPTSVDNTTKGEPQVDAAVDNVNCRDAIANDYNGKTAPKTNDCPPSTVSPISKDTTPKQVTR